MTIIDQLTSISDNSECFSTIDEYIKLMLKSYSPVVEYY